MTEAKMGDVVRINYTGSLTNGTQFDSSVGKEPLEFTIGLGQVIKGLEAHVAGMEPGNKSTVTIPCADAYGPHRAEAIQTLDRAKVPSGIDVRPGTQLQARTADGSTQEETPLEESKLMSADECARIILDAAERRRRSIVMTTQGKLTVWLNKLFPSLADSLIYKHFLKEPGSPLRKYESNR